MALAPFLAGVATHVVYFRRGEHHMYPLRYIKLLLACVAVSTAALSRTKPLSSALATVSLATLYFFVGVYSSLLIYRALLHPLNRFPGPVAARISDFWLSSQVGKGDAYRQVAAL